MHHILCTAAVSYTHLAYNGIVQIEVNHLANRTEVNRVKQEAAELTQTLAAFMGSSGLKTGDPIPSMRALAKSIHVSVITVQKAYELSLIHI